MTGVLRRGSTGAEHARMHGLGRYQLGAAVLLVMLQGCNGEAESKPTFVSMSDEVEHMPSTDVTTGEEEECELGERRSCQVVHQLQNGATFCAQGLEVCESEGWSGCLPADDALELSRAVVGMGGEAGVVP